MRRLSPPAASQASNGHSTTSRPFTAGRCGTWLAELMARSRRTCKAQAGAGTTVRWFVFMDRIVSIPHFALHPPLVGTHRWGGLSWGPPFGGLGAADPAEHSRGHELHQAPSPSVQRGWSCWFSASSQPRHAGVPTAHWPRSARQLVRRMAGRRRRAPLTTAVSDDRGRPCQAWPRRKS